MFKNSRNPLGFCGAEAIHNELADLGVRPAHSVRTSHRVLVRHHLMIRTLRDRSRKGATLPCPVAEQNDVHQVDFIVGHDLASRRPVVIFNRKDEATGLVSGCEEPDRSVQQVLGFLTKDWHRHGIPRFCRWTTT